MIYMPRDDLHQLVHNLSTAEKKYYAQQKGGGGNNLTIFNALNELDEYSKEAVEKRLRHHPDILKNISKYKNDLFKDILSELRAYRQDKYKSVDITLQAHLADVDLLMERTLYDRAGKLLKVTKELAMKFDKYLILLEIIKREEDLIRRLNPKKKREKRMSLIEEKKTICKTIDDENSYNSTVYLLFAAWQRLPRRGSEEAKAELSEIIKGELMLDEKRAISFCSKFRFQQIYALYYSMIGEDILSCQYYKRVIDIWDAHVHQREEYTLIYVDHLMNYLSALLKLGKQGEFENKLKWAKENVKPKYIHEKAMAFQTLSYVDLLYLFNTGQTERLTALAKEISKKMKFYSGKIDVPDYQAFLSTNAQIQFVLGKKDEAFKNFKQIIENRELRRIDVKCCAWVLLMAIAYDKGLENFDNLYRSTKRYMGGLKTGQLKNFYAISLKTIQQLYNMPLDDRKTALQGFNEKLKELEQQPTEHTAGLEEMLIWSEHKLRRHVSMMDILKERRGAVIQ